MRDLNLPGRTNHPLAVLYILWNLLNLISGKVLKLLFFRSRDRHVVDTPRSVKCALGLYVPSTVISHGHMIYVCMPD